MHTPEQVAASIKEIIKQKYGNLNAYAQEKNITPTQLYALLNYGGKNEMRIIG